MSSIQDDRYARPSPTSGASVVTGPALRCPPSGELHSYPRCVIICASIHTMDKRPAVRIRRLGSLDGPPSVVEIHKRGAVELVFDLPEPDLVEVTPGTQDWLQTVQPPEWIDQLLRRGASPREVIDVLRQRAGELGDLRQAAAVLHELAHGGYRPLVVDALRDWARESPPLR